MPFGMMTGLGQRNSVLRGVTIPEGEGAFFFDRSRDVAMATTFSVKTDDDLAIRRCGSIVAKN